MLRLVRYSLTNKHGYTHGPHYCTSSGPEHDIGFAQIGSGDQKATILDVAMIDASSGRVGLAKSYAVLAGADWLRFTAQEMVGIIYQAIESGEVDERYQEYIDRKAFV